MILDSFRLDGRVALVTGGSRGIGRAIAIALAEAGADVALASRTAGDLEAVASQVRSLGRRAVTIPTDVTSLPAIDGMVRSAIDRLGQIDVLVNGAGIPGRKPTIDLTEADYLRIYDTNIKSATFCSAYVGRHMISRNRGCILNVCSLTTTLGFPGRALYGPTKGAVGQLTKSLAVEWAPFGIRVNAIAPGWIYTDLSRGALDDPEFRRKVIERTPLGRIGAPADLAGISVFLASDASAFITGEIINVDGGYLAS